MSNSLKIFIVDDFTLAKNDKLFGEELEYCVMSVRNYNLERVGFNVISNMILKCNKDG